MIFHVENGMYGKMTEQVIWFWAESSHGRAWWLWCMAVKEGAGSSRMTSIATVEAAFQFLDLPMSCLDISIKPALMPFWIFVLGIKITE